MTTHAVVLAAGQSSRFEPFISESAHKAEVHLCGRPVLHWTFDELVAAGIQTVTVVVNPQHTAMRSIIEQYAADRAGVQFVVVEQHEPNGMADAVLTAVDHSVESCIVVDSGQTNCSDLVKTLASHSDSCVLSAQPTSTPELYGIVEVHDGRARRVVEKPSEPVVDPQRIIGVYKFSQDFLEYLRAQPMSEYVLEESLNAYCKDNTVAVVVAKGQFISPKYGWHLLDIREDIIDKSKQRTDVLVAATAHIHPTAYIEDGAYIGPGAIIGAFAVVESGVWVGAEAVVGQHCSLRRGSVLERGATLQRHADVAGSILMTEASIHSGFIGDSIVGKAVKIGAGFATANKRFDRKPIKVSVSGKRVDTKRSGFGALIGHEAQIGIQCGTMPGTIIEQGQRVMPGDIV